MKFKMLLPLTLGLIAVAVAAPTSEFDAGGQEATVTISPEFTAFPTPTSVDKAGEIGYAPFTLKITEYCQGGATRGVLSKAFYWSENLQFTHYFGADKAVSFPLYAGKNLVFGPYDYWNHNVIRFKYGDCVWGEDGHQECGFCSVTKAWRPSAPINCGAGNQEPRVKTLSCSVAVATRPKVARDTAQLDGEVHVLKPAGTITLRPQVIRWGPTAGPEPPMETLILPFHAEITESCEGGVTKAKGLYKNGGLDLNVEFPGTVTNVIDHLVNSYPALNFGPYDHSTSHLTLTYSHGANSCTWRDDETWKSCGECRAGLWSGPPLDCAAGGQRTKAMDCSFILDKWPASAATSEANSSLPEGSSLQERASFQERASLPPPLAHDPVGTISPTDNTTLSTSSSSSYAPGFCSFHLQLLQQCRHTPSSSWSTETLGLLFSMADNNRATVVTYPEGAGRIDAGAKRLLGMGDFRIAYASEGERGQVYFSFNGKWWATNTVDDGSAQGLCKWDAWTRGALTCEGEGGEERPCRISDMTCVFRC